MQVIIELTPKQIKFLKRIYGDLDPIPLFQVWLDEWIEKQAVKEYTKSKTPKEMIDELTK